MILNASVPRKCLDSMEEGRCGGMEYGCETGLRTQLDKSNDGQRVEEMDVENTWREL